jgi:hypothetical protein
MPGSEEKYGLASLLHPANPRPQLLSFGSGDIYGVKWDVGRGDGPSQYWELEYTVYTHELALCFDLSTRPAQELMASLTKKFSLSPDRWEGVKTKNKNKASILNKVRWDDGSPAPPKDKFLKGLAPRVIRDPQHPELVHVIWDTRQPAGQQQKDITDVLTHFQKLLPEQPQARRARPKDWANYLRVLDARAINPETNKPYETYEEIGFALYEYTRSDEGKKSGDYGGAKAQAKDAHENALRLTVDFPS